MASRNIVFNILRCVSLAVVFDFSPFFIFQIWLIRSLLRSNVQSSRIFVHGFAVYLVCNSGNTTSFTKKSHHALALPHLVQCLLCLSYGFLSSVLYCYGGISQNAPSINLRHFVSVRRSRNFGRARETASKKKCQKIGVGVEGEHERAQNWAYGTGVTV